MKCPACSDSLQTRQVGLVAVDVCDGGCGGIWFDNFELKQMDDPEEAVDKELLHVKRKADLVVDQQRRRVCPRCEGNVVMMRVFSSPTKEVEIDSCPSCGGTWLDAGELEKIRQESSRKAATQRTLSGQVDMAAIREIYRMKTKANVLRDRS